MLSHPLFQRALLLPVFAGLLLWLWATWLDRPLIPPRIFIEQAEPEPVLGPKAEFIATLAQMVVEENEAVLEDRNWLLQLSKKDDVAADEESRLHSLAKRYRVEELDNPPQLLIRDLLLRVDVVPPSLAIAQAALESAWGRSRFAREGNNLFGIWCFDPGCGLVPKRRSDGATHEVTEYSNVSDSVRDYILSINSHSAYAMLRELRSMERANGNLITASALTPGLTRYSAIGVDYVDRIEALVFANDLERFDRIPAPAAL